MIDRLVIDNARAARLLGRPALQSLVAFLIERDCSMAELVHQTGMSYSLLSHHLGNLCEQGVVLVSGQRPRAGRPTQTYRATARCYFIPARWCENLPGDQMARELRAALEQARAAQGVLFFSEQGPRLRLVVDDAAADTSELWLRLRLSPAQARQFNEEVRDLFERWRDVNSSAGRRYLIHVACVRVR